MSTPPRVVIDDRLLIEELLVGLRRPRRPIELYTTGYWYYRACRGAVAGAGGHLSGPFTDVPRGDQQRAIISLLDLRDDVELVSARTTVPIMAEIARFHPRLNLLNLEAVATARAVGGTVWLSEPTAVGILPSVLDQEQLAWKTIKLR